MKLYNMKNIIITAIISVLVTVFCFHAYIVYQLKKAVVQNSQAINQIVQFINSNTQAKQVE